MSANRKALAAAGAAAATLAVLPAAAHATAGPSTAPTAVVTKTVTVRDFAFTPKTITIHRGQAVKWVNKDPFTHTTTSNTMVWNHVLTAGKTFTFVFKKPGRFPYHCSIHPTMRAVVVVT